MNQKINFHTHTTYCDGLDTPENMIISAIEKGFTILGFSGHTMYPFASDWHIAPREHEQYVQEIRNLAQKYADKIKIFCGFEVDFVNPFTIPERSHFGNLNPDYLIGSVHYLVTQDGAFGIDESAEDVKASLTNFYHNDGKAAVCDYFELQRQMLRKGNFQIWGHPDLARKRNDILHFFDESDSWYKEQVKETVKLAAKTGVVAELNTGGIARGCMKDVYPSAFFLDQLFESKIPVCVNSDCHNKNDIDAAFDYAYEAARKAGYKELTYPTLTETFTVKL